MTQMSTDAFAGDLYFGLAGLSVQQPLVFTRGISLQSTYAYMMEPVIMAFKPAEPGKPHSGPWKETQGLGSREITAQLHVPEAAGKDTNERFQIASTIIFLLRLWTDPQTTMPVASNVAFAEVPASKSGAAALIRFEDRRHFFSLQLIEGKRRPDSYSSGHRVLRSDPYLDAG